MVVKTSRRTLYNLYWFDGICLFCPGTRWHRAKHHHIIRCQDVKCLQPQSARPWDSAWWGWVLPGFVIACKLQLQNCKLHWHWASDIQLVCGGSCMLQCLQKAVTNWRLGQTAFYANWFPRPKSVMVGVCLAFSLLTCCGPVHNNHKNSGIRPFLIGNLANQLSHWVTVYNYRCPLLAVLNWNKV